MKIGVFDIGVGNVASLLRMLSLVGYDSIRVSTRSEADQCSLLMLPGVGTFDSVMSAIEKSGLSDYIASWAELGNPLLGICAGMQALGQGSEEGVKEGMKLLPYRCTRFPSSMNGRKLLVPHMGWNSVSVENSPALKDSLSGSRFYFVHSYYVPVQDDESTLMVADYGVKISAAVKKGNIVGLQFHPEKSHKYGIRLFQNLSGMFDHV